MIDHTHTEKISDDSIEPRRAIRSSDENHYDRDIERNLLDSKEVTMDNFFISERMMKDDRFSFQT